MQSPVTANASRPGEYLVVGQHEQRLRRRDAEAAAQTSDGHLDARGEVGACRVRENLLQPLELTRAVAQDENPVPATQRDPDFIHEESDPSLDGRGRLEPEIDPGLALPGAHAHDREPRHALGGGRRRQYEVLGRRGRGVPEVLARLPDLLPELSSPGFTARRPHQHQQGLGGKQLEQAPALHLLAGVLEELR